MANSQLVGENFEQGLRTPYYVDGRMLTAQDLQADQQAVLARLALLGRATGCGVLDGLVVTQDGSNMLAISPGAGINRQGQVLQLSRYSARISVIPQDAAASSAGDGFQNCRSLSDDNMVTPGTGAYLLTVRPAARLEGSTPLKTAGSQGTMGTCASRWEVDGLEFYTTRLDDFTAPTGTQAPQLRNRLAHWCFGTAALRDLPRDPFSLPADYSGLDQIVAAKLTPCDLPLAVYYWNNRIMFVDNWSARRRLTRPDPTLGWGPLVGDQRLAESEACFLQFQEHIAGLPATGLNLGSIKASNHFRYLPPVGLLPVGMRLFNAETFFESQSAHQVGMIGGAQLRALLNEAHYYDPIDLSDPGLIRIYGVYENISAAAEGSSVTTAVVFTTAELPYRGLARYDYAIYSLDMFA